VFKKNGSRVVKQMIETGTMNDNEIIVRRGLTKGDLVMLARPAEQSGIDVETIPGLKPIVGGDSAKSVSLPVAPRSAAPAAVAPTTPAAKPKR
jgi:hypothetical protein